MFVRLIDVDGVPTVAEVIDFDPAERFTPEIAALFVQQEEGAVYMARKVDGEWIAPAAGPVDPAEPAEPTEPKPAFRLKLTPSEFRNAFSAFEEVAILDFSTAIVPDEPAQTKTLRKVVGVFFDRLKDPHLTTVDLADPRNQAGLDLLVFVAILTPARRVVVGQGLPA